MSYLKLSHKFTTIAASRPKINDLRFIYNYFLPDEAVNDFSDQQGGYMMSEDAADEFEKAKDFSNTVPRVIAITVETGQFVGSTPSEEIKSLLREKKLDDVIMKDIDLNYPNAMGIRVGDGEIMGRIAKLSKHLHHLKTGEETEDPTLMRETLAEVFVSDDGESIDQEKLDAIDACFVAIDPVTPTFGDGHEGIVRPHATIKAVNVMGDLPSENKFTKSAAYSVDLKISTRYFDDALAYASNFTSTPLTQFVLTNFSDLKKLSRVNYIEESYMSEEDLIVPLTFEKVSMHTPTQYANAGLVLQKYEINDNGLQHIEDTIYEVTDNANFTVYDPNIKYGTTYAYALRELYLITATVNGEMPVLGAGIYKTRFLIEGSPSPHKFVTCMEKIAPRPPEAIFAKRGIGGDGIMLQWQFPTNPQKDIKKFQVFRRKDIYEPFYLIKQIDFNNADPVIPGPEKIDPDLIEYAGYPKTVYHDTTFRREDKYIYAVCSVDAHGFSSTYGAQVEVCMDQYRNVLKIRTVSPAGAPKQYPNMYIKSTDAENFDTIRLTEDVAKTSGYDHVEIFFHPEAQSVTVGKTVKDVYKLALTPDTEIEPKFVFQFFNVDNGKVENVDILIRDVRKEKD